MKVSADSFMTTKVRPWVGLKAHTTGSCGVWKAFWQSARLELTGNFVSYKDDIASPRLAAQLTAFWDSQPIGSCAEPILAGRDCAQQLQLISLGPSPAFDQAFTSELTWKSAQLQLQAGS